MSRQEWSNDRFCLAAGVDRFTGAFVQVWDQPQDEQDEAVVLIDKLSLRVKAATLTSSLTLFLAELEIDMKLFRAAHGEYPNLDEQRVIRIAELLGFDPKQIAPAIYQLWGGDV